VMGLEALVIDPHFLPPAPPQPPFSPFRFAFSFFFRTLSSLESTEQRPTMGEVLTSPVVLSCYFSRVPGHFSFLAQPLGGRTGRTSSASGLFYLVFPPMARSFLLLRSCNQGPINSKEAGGFGSAVNPLRWLRLLFLHRRSLIRSRNYLSRLFDEALPTSLRVFFPLRSRRQHQKKG